MSIFTRFWHLFDGHTSLQVGSRVRTKHGCGVVISCAVSIRLDADAPLLMKASNDQKNNPNVVQPIEKIEVIR